MALSRICALAGLLTLALVSPALAQAPVEWYTDTGGGGVLAQPEYGPDGDGGVVAPVAPNTVIEPPAQTPAIPPAPEQALPNAKAASPAAAAPAEEGRAAAPAQVPEPAAEAAQVVDEPAIVDGDALPFTGIQLAAVAAAGLLLLVAGALLRPRRA